VVGDAEFAAVAADDGAGLAQMRRGHAREQVVLYLVVEPAEQNVGERAAPHVP
jgi:hypothetical protein